MTILHGKIPYEPVWNLEVVLRPEFVIDYTDRWPADQYKKYVNCELECYYENLEIAVMYDQTCLLQEKILNTHAVTLDQNSTLSFFATPAAGTYGTLVITQDATGGRTINTWNSTVTNCLNVRNFTDFQGVSNSIIN